MSDAVYDAIADPTRRTLLQLLAGGERSAGELASTFAVSRPAISRHLRTLREAGLVCARSESRRRIYTLSPAPLAEVDVWLETYRGFWDDALDRLERHLDDTREER